MRLFTALPLPGSAVDRLGRLRIRLAAPDDGLRWSSPEQWHITMRFFGEVDDSQARRLEDALRSPKLGRAEVCLDALGVFAAKGILYAQVAASSTLNALQAQIEQTVTGCGLLPESRAFRPHITLARSRGREGLRTLARLGSPELPVLGTELHWIASELLLFQSTLRPGGAEYMVRARFPLY